MLLPLQCCLLRTLDPAAVAAAGDAALTPLLACTLLLLALLGCGCGAAALTDSLQLRWQAASWRPLHLCGAAQALTWAVAQWCGAVAAWQGTRASQVHSNRPT
jgi:hypothetical protein